MEKLLPQSRGNRDGVFRSLQRAAIQSGMHCVGCPSSIGESLEQACAVHGLDVDEVLQSINEYLSAKKAVV